MAELSEFQLEQTLDAWWDEDGHSAGDPEPLRADIATVQYLSTRHIAPNPDPAFVRRLRSELVSNGVIPNGVTAMPIDFHANGVNPPVSTRVIRRFWPEQRRRLWGLAELATAAVLVVTLLGITFGNGPLGQLHDVWPQSDVQTPKTGPTGMYRGNAARTGVSTSAGPAGQPELRWTRQYHPTGYFGYRGTVIAAGNRLYLSQDRDGRVNSLDATTGNLIWSANVGTIDDCPPAVGNGLVYIATANGTGFLIALDEQTGTERWRYAAGGCRNSSPAVDGNTVYITASDETLRAVDAQTGQERWRANLARNDGITELPTPFGIRSSPAIANGIVYAGNKFGTLIALDAQDGHELWRFQTSGDVIYTPAVVDRTVYFTAFQTNGMNPAVDGWVYALDAATGKERWDVKAGDQSQSAPAVADGLVFLGSTGEADATDSSFTALDSATGDQVWAVSTDGIFTSNLTYANGVVYGTNDLGGVYAVDARSGNIAWRVDVASHPTNSAAGHSLLLAPTIVDDLVIVPADDGTIYAFGSASAQATPAASPSPEPSPSTSTIGMYRGDAARTGVSADSGPSGQPVLKWKERFHSVGFVESGVAAGGTIYLPQDDRGEVIAVDAATGKLIWTAKVGVIAGSPPAVANGTVYVATAGPHAEMQNNDPGYLIALDAVTGAEKWRFETGGSANASPAIDGDTVFVENVDQTLFAVDAQTGQERWHAALAEKPIDEPYANVLVQNATVAVAQGVVFAPNYNGTLFAIDVTDGHELWRFKTDGEAVNTPAIADGMAYFTAPYSPGGVGVRGWVYAVDASNGQKRWSVVAIEFNRSAPAVADGSLFLGGIGEGAPVTALDARDGHTLWTHKAGGTGASDVTYANGGVVGTTFAGDVFALDAGTGDELWHAKVDLPTGPDGVNVLYLLAPTITDDLLIVPETDGIVYAIGGDGSETPEATNPAIVSVSSCLPPRPFSEASVPAGTPAATLLPGRQTKPGDNWPPILQSEIPEGKDASDEASAGIMETIQGMAACGDDWRALLGFYSDDFWRRSIPGINVREGYYPGADRTEITGSGGKLATTFNDIRELPDDRVGVLIFSTGSPVIGSYVIFAEQDGVWLIDERYDVVADLPATPSPTA
ncbi:MAG: PQQ-binding-like beta-propeller repeat protein [Thermomicrobiales bacterium]